MSAPRSRLSGPAEGEQDESIGLRELAADKGLVDEPEFLGASPYVPLDDGTAELVEAVVAEDPQTSALAFFTRAADHVRSRLEYRIGTTTVESSVAEVLAGGVGVCQDFAHVLISLCRHAGLCPVRERLSRQRRDGGRVARLGGGVHAAVRLGGSRRDARRALHGAPRQARDRARLRRRHGAAWDVPGRRRGDARSGGGLRVARRAGPSAQPRVERDEHVGRLVAIQNLGAMRQYQRGAVIVQAMGGMTQTLTLDELPPPRSQVRPEDGRPVSNHNSSNNSRRGGAR